MPVIHLTTKIIAPIERCFDLSRSIDLHLISTHHTKEKAIAGRTHGLIQLGETVTWQAFHFGIRQQLTSKITGYNYPTFFMDEMVKGVFSFITHEHHFHAEKEFTIMVDEFEYGSPLGILGHIADTLFLKGYLRRLLEDRNDCIRRYAESEMWKDVLIQ